MVYLNYKLYKKIFFSAGQVAKNPIPGGYHNGTTIVGARTVLCRFAIENLNIYLSVGIVLC